MLNEKIHISHIQNLLLKHFTGSGWNDYIPTDLPIE